MFPVGKYHVPWKKGLYMGVEFWYWRVKSGALLYHQRVDIQVQPWIASGIC